MKTEDQPLLYSVEKENPEFLESYRQIEEVALDEALCGAGEIRRDLGEEDPRCDECVCQG